MVLNIRIESEQDYDQVDLVIRKAFEKMEESDQTEHMLVRKIRESASYIPELSLVAEYQNRIIGHILLSAIKIVNEDSSKDSLALAPISVHPDYQNKGVGSQLIKHVHDKAQRLGHRSIILLGHPGYYPRFGYIEAANFGIRLPFEAPSSHCMAIELTEDSLKNISGTVVYPEPFMN